MYKEIKYNIPQNSDLKAGTKPGLDTVNYYNFDNAALNKNNKEDNLSIIKNNYTQKNENTNQTCINKSKNINTDTQNYFNSIFIPQLNNIPAKTKLINNQQNKNIISNQKKIYSEKTIQKKSNNLLKYNSESKDWIIILILLLLFVLSWIRLTYYKTLQQIIKSSYNLQSAQKFYRERNSLSQRISYILNTSFILSTGLFMYFVLNYYDIHILKFSGIILYFICCGILAIVYIFKYLIYRILGNILLSRKYFSEYLYNLFIYNKIIGILILPIIIGIPFMPQVFSPILIKTGIVLIILLLIFRMIRGIKLSFKFKLSILYIFLYLCTLEILPVFIFIKIFTL